jgi:anti-anti-sigma factor
LLSLCCLSRSEQLGSLLLDFQSVRYINGLGASMLVKLITLTVRRKMKTIACGVNTHHRDILKITGLNSVISVFDSSEEALASVNYSCGETGITLKLGKRRLIITKSPTN